MEIIFKIACKIGIHEGRNYLLGISFERLLEKVCFLLIFINFIRGLYKTESLALKLNSFLLWGKTN